MGALIDDKTWEKARSDEEKLREKLDKKEAANKKLAKELADSMAEALQGLVKDHRAAQDQAVVAERYVGELESRLEGIKYEHHDAILFVDTELQERLQTEARDIRERKLPEAREDLVVARETVEETRLDEEALFEEWKENYRPMLGYYLDRHPLFLENEDFKKHLKS